MNTTKNIYQKNCHQEKYEKILQICQNTSTKNNITLTRQKLYDIFSLTPNISNIENEKIFIKNKKKHGGMLNTEKFLQK